MIEPKIVQVTFALKIAPLSAEKLAEHARDMDIPVSEIELAIPSVKYLEQQLVGLLEERSGVRDQINEWLFEGSDHFVEIVDAYQITD